MAVPLHGPRTGDIGFPQKIPLLGEIDFSQKTYQIGKIISLCVRTVLWCMETLLFPHPHTYMWALRCDV